jgi:hypothetical protein
MQINLWKFAFIFLTIGAVITLIPIALAFFRRVKLHETPKWFGEADALGDQQQRMIDHEIRMEGTLLYWKNKACTHHRIHNARIFWSLLSAVSLPALIQFFDQQNTWAVAFMTGLTTWTGFVVALAYALKSEQIYQGFRQCESDYYDMARELLDWPEKDPEKLKESVDTFIYEAEIIRKKCRKIETGSPPSSRSGRSL